MQAGEESICELVDEEGLPETKQMQSRPQQMRKADAERISADEKQVKQIAFCSLLRRCSERIITFEGFGWEANFWPPPFLILHSEQATRPLIWNIGNLYMYNTLTSGNINLEVQRAQRSLSGAHHYQSGYSSCLLSAQGVRQSR